MGSIIVFAGHDLLTTDSAADPRIDPLLIEGLSFDARRDFDWHGQNWRALRLDAEGARGAEARGLVRMPTRQAIANWDSDLLRPFLKGLALLNWIEGARYCGACGSALVDPDSSPADAELRESSGRICPTCKRPHFPRISPAVIVLVRKEGKILLARNARLPPGGRFGLLAGFVEAGETLEEAAIREVREEAGIEIGSLRYRSSQPWPFPDSLMLAFSADWISGEARPDGREIAELRWCGPNDLPEIPPKGSVARSLIDGFASENSSS